MEWKCLKLEFWQNKNRLLFDFHEAVKKLVKKLCFRPKNLCVSDTKNYVFQTLWAAWSVDCEHHHLPAESSVQSQVTAGSHLSPCRRAELKQRCF